MLYLQFKTNPYSICVDDNYILEHFIKCGYVLALLHKISITSCYLFKYCTEEEKYGVFVRKVFISFLLLINSRFITQTMLMFFPFLRGID